MPTAVIIRKAVLGSLCLLAAVADGHAYRSPDLGDVNLFPADNYWHWDISTFAVHPNSANFVKSAGAATSLHPDFGTVYENQLFGIPYSVVDKGQAKIPINFTAWPKESDPGPYPIPLTAPVEGGVPSTGDRHVLAVDKDARVLYELYHAYPRAAQWDASSGAVFDLKINDFHHEGWTSADAAGLPILPGLVRYEEIAKGEINHAIRMTVSASQDKYIWPASHSASDDGNPNLAPMGLRFRLKGGFKIETFPPQAQVVLKALKKYGMIVADNGSDWYISGAPDERFDDDDLNTLKRVKGGDFEAVLTLDAAGNPIRPNTGVLFLSSPRGLRGPLADAARDFLGRWVPLRAGSGPQPPFHALGILIPE